MKSAKRGFVTSEFEREDLIKKWLTVHKPKRITFLGLWPEQAGVSKTLAEIVEYADHFFDGKCVEWLRAIPLGANLHDVDSKFCAWCWDVNLDGLTEEQRAQKMFDKLMELTRLAPPFKMSEPNPAKPEVSAGLRLPDLLSNPTWMKGHYHCRKCGGEMECWKALRWKVQIGVRRLGGCVECGQIFVEYEDASPKWVEVAL